VAFRDDREALLQRVGALERELAAEQADRAEADSARQRLLVELAAARQELEQLRPYAPAAEASRSRGLFVLGLGLAIAVAGSMFAWAALQPKHEVATERGVPEPAGPREEPRGSALAPVLPAGATGCRSNCDCTGGAGCTSGQCLLGTEPAYCCGDPRCPAGTTCQRPDGVSSTCGTDSTAETRAAITAVGPALQECLERIGSPRGRVVARVRFGVDGGVTRLALDVTDGNLRRALPCIDDTLRAMTIAPPGRVLDVEVPFVFAGAP